LRIEAEKKNELKKAQENINDIKNIKVQIDGGWGQSDIWVCIISSNLVSISMNAAGQYVKISLCSDRNRITDFN
jgi:hypothetical protein